jgi:hypothetical protein
MAGEARFTETIRMPTQDFKFFSHREKNCKMPRLHEIHFWNRCPGFACPNGIRIILPFFSLKMRGRNGWQPFVDHHRFDLRRKTVFFRNGHGNRPVYGGTEKFQSDPHWRATKSCSMSTSTGIPGLGASHQTGWTGVVAKLIHLFGLLDAIKLLEAGKGGAFLREKSER